MKFGVIYTIEWNRSEGTECPFEEQDDKELLALFEKTEDHRPANTEDDGLEDEDDDPVIYSCKFASRELLTREQFDRFLDVTRMRSDSAPTMGSIIGYAWGLGWTAPAVRFHDPGNRTYEESAYVTPVPDVEPRDIEDDEEFAAYQMRCWERVRDAVVRHYEDGVPQ